MSNGKQLVVNGLKQSVTTIVTLEDDDGKVFVLLGRSDPRYADFAGKSVSQAGVLGENLPVGAYQFVGGQVDDDGASGLFDAFIDKNTGQRKKDIDKNIDATALRELGEEVGLTPDMLGQDAYLQYIDDIKREGHYGAQQIHYLHLYLGKFPAAELPLIMDKFSPQDDMLVTSFVDVAKIKRNEENEPIVLAKDTISKVKQDFAGFPELAAWDADWAHEREQARGDEQKIANITQVQNNFHRINDELRGLEGIDLASLQAAELGFYAPQEVNILGDGKMLELLVNSKGMLLAEPESSLSNNSRNFMFFTENPYKIKEYKNQFAQYGVGVIAHKEVERSEIKALLFDPTHADATSALPKYAFWESSDLYDLKSNQVIKHADLVKKLASGEGLEKIQPAYVKAKLICYYVDNNGELVEEPAMERRVDGYIDLAKAQTRASGVFAWDDVFVNGNTDLSLHEQVKAFGSKCSPRQMLLSDWMHGHLFYDQRKSLYMANGELAPADKTIDLDYSLADEFAGNAYYKINKQHIDALGISNLVLHTANDGIHARCGDNRRTAHYWAPGLNAGIPNVEKAGDLLHQATFRLHDIMHYSLAPVTDLLVTGAVSEAQKKVYQAARMTSEAITLVLADMLFVDGLKHAPQKVDEKHADYDYAMREIYPLFENLNLQGTQQEKIKQILWANVQFAVLGDDIGFRALLKDGAEAELALEKYKDKFARFFVADNRWSAANLENMQKDSPVFARWAEMVGSDAIEKANLHKLSEVTEKIQTSAAMNSYPDVVRAVFEDIVDNYLLPRMAEVPEELSRQERKSNAFRRYMLGQVVMYAKFSQFEGVQAGGGRILKQLQEDKIFSDADIAQISKQFAKDVSKLHSAGLISDDDCTIYSDVFPIFPPFYVAAYSKEHADIKAEISRIFPAAKMGEQYPFPEISAFNDNALGVTKMHEVAQYK